MRGISCSQCGALVTTDRLRSFLLGKDLFLYCATPSCNTRWRRAFLQENLGAYFGAERKEEGQSRVQENAEEWIKRVRQEARRVAIVNGEVSADDLRQWADAKDDHPHHQNAWGSVFRGDEWTYISRKKSTYVTNNAREIKVWALTSTIPKPSSAP